VETILIIPAKVAATGILIKIALDILESLPSLSIKGMTEASIIAAVAVLDIMSDKTEVTIIIPRISILGLAPNKEIVFLNSDKSKFVLRIPSLRKKPPKKIHITLSDQVSEISFGEIVAPSIFPFV